MSTFLRKKESLIGWSQASGECHVYTDDRDTRRVSVEVSTGGMRDISFGDYCVRPATPDGGLGSRQRSKWALPFLAGEAGILDYFSA